MGLERIGGCPTGDGVKHGRLHLYEIMLGEEFPDLLNRLGADEKNLFHLRICDESK